MASPVVRYFVAKLVARKTPPTTAVPGVYSDG